MSVDKVELHIRSNPRDEGVVVLSIPRERLALALIGSASETEPIMINEAWGNGDSAQVIIKRIPWREAPWRDTTQGWVKGPYRIWCSGADKTGYRVACAEMQIAPGPFETLEMAKVAAMRHADAYRAEVP